LQVKYLGGALDPAPVATFQDAPATHVLFDNLPPAPSGSGPSQSPSKLYQYDGGNIKHYTTFADTKPAVVDIAKAAAEAGVPVPSPPRRPSLNTSQAGGITAAGADPNNSVLSNVSVGTGGWSSAVRSAQRDTSAVLNSSAVAEHSTAKPAAHKDAANVSLNTSSLNTSLDTAQAHRGSAALRGPAQDRDAADVSVMREKAHGVNRNDLSMVSFMGDPYEAQNTSVHSHSRTLSGPEQKSLPRLEENDSEDFDNDAGLRPQQADSPPKRGVATRYADPVRRDSQTSSTGSWKSAQPSRSPDKPLAPPAPSRTPRHAHHHGRGGDQDRDTASDTAEESPSEAEAVHPMGVHDSEETTPRRDAYPVRDLGLPSAHSSGEGHAGDRNAAQRSSQDDAPVRRSSLSSAPGGAPGAGGVTRFSSESAIGAAQRDAPWASPTSPGSAAGELSESGNGSVKMRQIRTIHVSSPTAAGSASHGTFAAEPSDLRTRSSSDVMGQVDVSRETSRGGQNESQGDVPASRFDHRQTTRSDERRSDHSTTRRFDDDATVRSNQSDHYRQTNHDDTSHSRADHSGRQATNMSTHRASLSPSRHKRQHSGGSPQRAERTTGSNLSLRHDTREHSAVLHGTATATVDKEVVALVSSLQERLHLLEAQVSLSSEAELLRKESQARLEERWTNEIIALNLRNQQTVQENARLQDELQRWKVECATTQAALSAAEASKRTLLLTSEGQKDRAQHEALDTVIAQKRLIASLETHLLECNRQMKTLEQDLGYMRDKHCTTATSLITWKAKAIELSARQGSASVASGGSRHSRLHNVTAEAFTRVAAQSDSPNDLDGEVLRSHSAGGGYFADHQGGTSVSPSEASVEHKDAHGDTDDAPAHFGNISQSRIPANMSAFSGGPYQAHDASFRTEGGGSSVFPNMQPGLGSDGVDDVDVGLDAQRKAAARITRQ
jgi:hypothetical protein